MWSVGTSMASGSRGLLAECGLSGQVWRVSQEACRWVWSVGAKMLRGSKGLSLECGLSARKCCVGQENCRRGVVCRGEKGEWVKRPVGGVWSVGAKMLRGSKELAAECGLSGRKGRVGQRNCRQSLVCRGEKGEWVKRIVGGVWSVGTSLLRGSKELATACGLSAQVCCVGQENCRRVWSVGSSMASGSKELSASVVCRDKYGEWVKGIVGRVWSVGAKRASGSKELSAECGLSGRKGRVGQEACWRRVVCRDKYVAWVKGIVGGVWSVGSKRASGSRELSAGVVCRCEKGEWVKGTVARVWSVGVKRASEPKKPHISYASNVANCHSDQNCQNPQNMIHLL